MKSCLVRVMLILWYTSIASLCWNAHALNCTTDELSCDISGGTLQSICIPRTASNIELDISIGQELKLSCRWTSNQTDNQYRWNITAPEGWQILLRVISEQVFKIDAGNRNIKSSEDASYNSLEDLNFHGVDEFISITNMIWIEASINPNRDKLLPGFNKTFDIVARTVKVTDAVDTQRDGCHFRRMQVWGSAGYVGTTQSKGSMNILCNNTSFQHSDVLISVSYDVDTDNFPANGSLQFVYVKPRNLMTRITPNLDIKFNFVHYDSFRIRFDASGSMKLNISNVKVQGLIYDDDVTETACILSSTSNSISNSSTSTSAEGTTSFTQENMTTWISETVTMTTEGMAADSLPIFLIPTVSVVAIFFLVFLAVLCVCLRKRCHTNRSRGRDSAPPDDPASFNNEHHEYCEVRPSLKSPPDKTASGVTDQSVGHKNYAFVVTGPAMVVADDETVHSGDKTAEVNTPTANNKVLSNGPVYTLVDMDKKALDREEKANNARNRGNAYVSNVDKLDFIPLDEYETVTVSPPVSPGASASLRPDSYPLSEYETVSPPMSPAAMAPELERPYDTLQRGPVSRKQTATSSTVDKKVNEEADHDDALNVYNEIATPAVALMESEEGSEAYQHLQRPLSKRPKAGASLPEIPDEGYGRLDLGGSGASNQMDPFTYQAQDSQGPKTTQVDPMYAILEKPAEANVPDDDDPEYDLLDACV